MLSGCFSALVGNHRKGLFSGLARPPAVQQEDIVVKQETWCTKRFLKCGKCFGLFLVAFQVKMPRRKQKKDVLKKEKFRKAPPKPSTELVEIEHKKQKVSKEEDEAQPRWRLEDVLGKENSPPTLAR